MFKKGLTLIEVVLTIGIFSLVILTVFSLFGVASKPYAIINQEFDIQTNSRMVVQEVSNYILDASAIFIHESIEDIFTDSSIYPESANSSEVIRVDESFVSQSHINKREVFIKALEKYKGWNFITLSSDGKELRQFTYNEENNKGFYELRRIINNSNVDICYELDFKKNDTNYDNNLLSFNLVGKLSNDDKAIEITTEIKTINTLQVVDRSGYNPGRVLFFRKNSDAQAAVAMVLDKSGSMRENTEVNGKRISKIEALGEQSKELISSFSGLDNAEITLIPFSTNANNPKNLVSVGENKGELLEYINNNFGHVNHAEGGTNIGDGIRRAYHILKEYNDKNVANQEANKYLIILMDGVPTYGSIKSNKWDNKSFSEDKGSIWRDDFGNLYYNYNIKYKFLFLWPYEWDYRRPMDYKVDSGNISSKDLVGSGSESDENAVYGMGYISAIEKELDDIKNLKIYLIGFFTGSNGKEVEYFNMIKDILSKPGREVDGYISNNGDQLNMAVKEIEESILNNYWRIYGPGE
ncbi:VWA domain-containing protein [Tissierella sp. Yu-01]|uniref:VWA domain-containing protein n=1 Tax=Tissierella sp. Yu-01 TaxID=3035694 RepID=UPI00240D1359|nr:VWA domain-containing protein [Tissierella sp. Yu-01]WFA09180.1 VWA domain-containing protein [Tissierella sp. Yu-01]